MNAKVNVGKTQDADFIKRYIERWDDLDKDMSLDDCVIFEVLRI